MVMEETIEEEEEEDMEEKVEEVVEVILAEDMETTMVEENTFKTTMKKMGDKMIAYFLVKQGDILAQMNPMQRKAFFTGRDVIQQQQHA